MIYIGVTGWRDHSSLYEGNVAAHNKLKEYGAHFPTVEVDAAFYAVQSERNVAKWVHDTPNDFRFVVKAYQGMTGHQRGDIPFETKEAMFQAFNLSLKPYLTAGKLAMVLFQFPPWFDCTKENVAYLRYCRQMMRGVPVALEFRNRSWFSPQFKEKTLQFMQDEDWVHTICDEPQIGERSVPTVLRATNKQSILIRMHGRNEAAWRKPGGDNWREVRYLYRYNQRELQEWKEHIVKLQEEAKDIYVLFNNNSGGDAVHNAKQLIAMLGIEYKGLAAKQLNLFG